MKLEDFTREIRKLLYRKNSQGVPAVPYAWEHWEHAAIQVVTNYYKENKPVVDEYNVWEEAHNLLRRLAALSLHTAELHTHVESHNHYGLRRM